jgi:hypothetical protein
MPTDANVPPLDSFESDNKAFQEDKRVEMRDRHLNACLNPDKGADRPVHNQYDRTIWAPGRENTIERGGKLAGSPEGVTSESAARVASKLA